MPSNTARTASVLCACFVLYHVFLYQIATMDHFKSTGEESEVFDRAVLKSPLPLAKFRDNLVDDEAYVTTTVLYGGFTNQLIAGWNAAYLGRVLDRAVILPRISDNHHDSPYLPWDSIFDMDRFARDARIATIEWPELKLPADQGGQHEELTCWGKTKNSRVVEPYDIKVNFRRIPSQLAESLPDERELTYPIMQVLASVPPQRWFGKRQNNSSLSEQVPDEKVLCFDHLYFATDPRFVHGKAETRRIEDLDDPVWRDTGRHMHFNKRLQSIADQFLAELGVASRDFVAVHIRQGDFVTKGVISGESRAKQFSDAVETVQDELLSRRRSAWSRFNLKDWRSVPDRLPVVFATDSTNITVIQEYQALGWTYLNHTLFATEDKFEKWFPPILDSVVLSKGSGLVGMKRSTYSQVAARRVESWQNGVTAMVNPWAH